MRIRLQPGAGLQEHWLLMHAGAGQGDTFVHLRPRAHTASGSRATWQTFMKAKMCRTTVHVHVAKNPRQNRLMVRKLLPCGRAHAIRLTPSWRRPGGTKTDGDASNAQPFNPQPTRHFARTGGYKKALTLTSTRRRNAHLLDGEQQAADRRREGCSEARRGPNEHAVAVAGVGVRWSRPAPRQLHSERVRDGPASASTHRLCRW